MTRPSEKARLRAQARQAQALVRARRQVIAMPLVVTGIVGAMGLASSLETEANAADLDSTELAPVSATYAGSEPEITLTKKQVPRAKPWVAPVSGYRLTARFGASSGLWSRDHTGLDFAAPSGATIRSVTSGVVVSAGYDGAYGYKTVVRATDGTELWYCHQTSFRVEAGQKVLPGQVIGTVGSTGNATGPHLHLEVRPSPDQPIDPYAALRAHGVRL